MIIQMVFNHFCSQLRRRTKFVSEDNVRYYWFTAMLHQDPNLNNYTLEQPYTIPALKDKEMDLLYEDSGDIFCFEIKFHRKHNKSKFPHTDAAGELFDDFLRLGGYKNTPPKNIHRYLLYVTDEEMDKYLNGKGNYYRNELNKFYNMGNTCSTFNFDLSKNAPITFLKKAYDSFGSVSSITKLTSPAIRLVSRLDFPTSNKLFNGGKCHIRLYELCNKDDKSCK